VRLGRRPHPRHLSLGPVLAPGRRIGEKKAAVAVGHSILVVCWHLLADDCDYGDLGGDYYTRRNSDRRRDRLIAQLHSLGYRITLDQAA
jgi:transposase